MTLLLYWLGVKGYELAIRIAVLWNEKAAEAVRGRWRLPTKIEAAMAAEDRPRVWMHCSSLGEFEQGRPVLEALREKHPGHAFVLTFFSPSGYRVRKDWPGADYVFYLPFDGAVRARRLVKALRPALAIWVKYEFWYFTLRALKQAGVPTILIAAVFPLNSPFFQWWGGFHRQMLRGFSRIFVQDKASLARLRAKGIAHVDVAGDPRYDRVAEAVSSARNFEKAERFAELGFIIVAGSTWPVDEAMLVKALHRLPQDVRLLLVPHEVGEAHLRSIEQQFADCMRWSAWDETSRIAPRVLLVDSVGMLMDLYRYAQVAYVGGGFGRTGVHNVLEPAAYGVPVFMGRSYSMFVKAGVVINSNGEAIVHDAVGFAAHVLYLFGHEEARQAMGQAAAEAIRDGAGATERIVSKIDEAGWLSTGNNTSC